MTWRVLNPWRDLAGLPRDSWLLALATLVNRAGTMVLPFLALYLTQDLHFSAGEAGAAIAVYGGVSLVISPIAGQMADRFGHQRILVSSLILGGLGFWALPLLHTLPQVMAGMVVLSVVSESMRPATLALVGDLAPAPLRRQAFALNRLAINLGMSVGPAAGGFLATRSFHTLFWVDGATSIAAGLLLRAFPLREREHVDAAAAAPVRLTAIADPRLRYVILCALPVILVFFQHGGPMSVWMVQGLGFSTSDFGFLFTVNTVLIVFLEVRLNALTSHWRPGRALSIGAALVALGFGALAVSTPYWAIVATVVVWTFGEMIFFPASAAYVSDLAPRNRRGEYMGFYSMTFGLGFALGPWIGLATYQSHGATTLWIGSLVAGLVSSALLSRVRSEVPATVEAPVPDVTPG